jgi:Ca-activated chloride channel family protein
VLKYLMHFTFGIPYILLLLLLLPCFIWCKVSHEKYYFSQIHWVSKQSALHAWEYWVKLALFSLMVLALARPFIYDTLSPQHRKGRDLILALDASGSMAQSGFNAKDRFQTKFETNIILAKDFIKKRLDDNIGIVLFGTFAYTASALTYDLKTLSYLLEMTNVGIAGESTAIGDALVQSMHTLSYGEAKNKVIILLSDGYHNAGHISPKKAVEIAQEKQIKIYTIGIGKKSDYDVALLKTIASQTHAKSYAASSAKALHDIYSEINTLEPSNIRSENYLNQKLLLAFPLGLAFILLFLWVATQEWKGRARI